MRTEELKSTTLSVLDVLDAEAYSNVVLGLVVRKKANKCIHVSKITTKNEKGVKPTAVYSPCKGDTKVITISQHQKPDALLVQMYALFEYMYVLR